MIWPVDLAADRLDDGEVSLRPYSSADAEGLFAAVRDDRVWAHLPRQIPVTAADLDTVMRASVGDATRIVFTIRVAGVIVGTTSVHYDPADPVGVEIGSTMLDQSTWGTGINTRAKHLLIRELFAAGASWIQFRTDERNGRSAAAIRKLGATDLGVRQDRLVRRDGTVRRSRFFRLERTVNCD
ncbi:GNAT family N-acetyltransferase [Nocardia tengchongensis]|uniref:GNAT family N-acetyltransferase n=1 Tax=Nocardia tengchongensis TaxID=2055889 RepID=UPI0036874693